MRTSHGISGVKLTFQDQERAIDGEHWRGGRIGLAEIGVQECNGGFPRIIQNGGNGISALQPIGMQEVFAEMDSGGGLVAEGKVDGCDSVLEIAEIEAGSETVDGHVFDQSGTGNAAAQCDCAVCLSIGIEESDIFDRTDVADGPIDGHGARIAVSDRDGQILNIVSKGLVSAAIGGIVCLLEASGRQECARICGIGEARRVIGNAKNSAIGAGALEGDVRAKKAGGIGADERALEIIRSGRKVKKGSCSDGIGNGLLNGLGVVFPVIWNSEIGGFCNIDNGLFRKVSFRQGVRGEGGCKKK